MAEKIIKQKVFGPITLKMTENELEQYSVIYSVGDRKLEDYEYMSYDAAELDWNTLCAGFRNMIWAIKNTLEMS